MKSLKFYIIAIFLLLLNSCVILTETQTVPRAYPQPVDIPLINEKNQMKVNAGVSAAAGIGFNGTVSYGLTDKIAVQAHGNYEAIMGVYNISGATGLFKPFGKNNVFEWYGGYGYGNETNKLNKYNNLPEKNSYTTHLAYTQFNIGQINRIFEYGASVRVGYLHASTKWGHQSFDKVNYSHGGLIVEPSAFFCVGTKNLKFGLHYHFLLGNFPDMVITDDKGERYENKYLLPYSIRLNVSYRINFPSKQPTN
jgi:hypothetical protein